MEKARFVTREMTVRELIYLTKGSQNDYESQVKLIQSRAVEPIDDLLDMTASEFHALMEECLKGINQSFKTSRSLTAILTASVPFTTER